MILKLNLFYNLNLVVQLKPKVMNAIYLSVWSKLECNEPILRVMEQRKSNLR